MWRRSSFVVWGCLHLVASVGCAKSSSNDGGADTAAGSHGGRGSVEEAGTQAVDGPEAGAAGAPNSDLCPGHQGFVTIVGELPYFGKDVSLTEPCTNSVAPPYRGVASHLGGPGEGTGHRVTIASCSADQALRMHLVLDFGAFPSDANPSGFEGGSLRFDGEASSSVSITELVETEKPVDLWRDVTLGTDAGVGKLYTGSFVAAGDVFGTPASVTGTFSACHVANVR